MNFGMKYGEIIMYKGYQENLFKSSWATNSGFENLRDQLSDLLPDEGKVEKSRSTNKKLEHFRVAQNLIYDLFNNGLMNRRNHFRHFFGWAPAPESHRYQYSRYDWERFENTLEPVFTQIMQEAALEQGVKCAN